MSSYEMSSRYSFHPWEESESAIDNKNVREADLLSKFNMWRKEQVDKPAFIFMMSGKEIPLTYGKLWIAAEQAAICYKERTQFSTRPVALLLYSWGPEFIVSLLACMMANIIPVPAPIPLRHDQIKRTEGIISDSGAEIIFTSESGYETICHSIKNCNLPILTADWLIDKLPEDRGDLLNPFDDKVNPRDYIAFIQYTSGSTGDPKGVVITNRNLASNLSLIEKAFNLSSDTVHASWLPFFHDMGLVGSIFGTLWCGGTAVLMSPESFIRQPWKWLQAISDYKADVSGGPNFAYDLCAKRVKPEHMESLDLRCWKVAFNGAEPIRSTTLDNFYKLFSGVGFARESFSPCYGLAEATLMVASSPIDAAPVITSVDADDLERNLLTPSYGQNGARIKNIVSSGRVENDTIVIVEPADKTLMPDGCIGEVWVHSDSVASGYWKADDDKNKDLHQHLGVSEISYLRTGDVGVILEKEIYIIGRSCDIIIDHGRNIYPADIEEHIALAIKNIENRPTAAIQLHSHNDRIIIVQEVQRRVLSDEEFINIVYNIKNVSARDFGLHVNEIILVPPGAIPKTTSGKIRRNLLAQNIIYQQCDIIYKFVSP